LGSELVIYLCSEQAEGALYQMNFFLSYVLCAKSIHVSFFHGGMVICLWQKVSPNIHPMIGMMVILRRMQVIGQI